MFLGVFLNCRGVGGGGAVVEGPEDWDGWARGALGECLRVKFSRFQVEELTRQKQIQK